MTAALLARPDGALGTTRTKPDKAKFSLSSQGVMNPHWIVFANVDPVLGSRQRSCKQLEPVSYVKTGSKAFYTGS